MGWGISMQYCRFCGAEAPNDARFCGYCGRTLTDMAKGQGNTIGPTEPAKLPINTPAILSNPLQPRVPNTATGQKDVDATIRPGEAQAEMAQNIQQPAEYQSRGQTVPAFGYHPPQQTPPTAPIPFYEQQQSYHSASSGPISQVHGLAARLMAGKTAKWVLLLVTVIMVLVISGIGVVLLNPNAPALSGIVLLPLTERAGAFGFSNTTPGKRCIYTEQVSYQMALSCSSWIQ